MWNELSITKEPELGLLQRNGHTSVIYNEKMIVFGGIMEVTQELDDMVVLDLRKR